MPSPTAVSSPTVPSTRPTKKERQATARKRASIEAQIASTDKLVEKRRAQLASASAHRAALTARLARLSAAGEAPGPAAYCLKERRRVLMVGAHSVTLANRRPATAGTCPSCGSRLVRIGIA